MSSHVIRGFELATVIAACLSWPAHSVGAQTTSNPYAITCQVNVRTHSVSCTGNGTSVPGGVVPTATPNGGVHGMSGSMGANIGINLPYTAFAFGTPSLDTATQIYSVPNVTIQNLLARTIGTPDGSTVTGVNVFFVSGPTTTSGTGTVTVANATGTGAFTDVNQMYFLYNQTLSANQVSATKTWQFAFHGTVNGFHFGLLVYAASQT